MLLRLPSLTLPLRVLLMFASVCVHVCACVLVRAHIRATQARGEQVAGADVKGTRRKLNALAPLPNRILPLVPLETV